MDIGGKKYKPKRYIAMFTMAAIALLLGLGLISYIVDPFFQFRVKENSRYFLNPRFVNGGLAKHYDYDVVALGSSMVQNYNLSIIRKNNPGAKPVKLSTGGMNLNEMEYLYSFIDKEKTKECIINLDMPLFNNKYGGVRYPRYLYDDGIMNKLKYLYGYETLIQFVPIDIGLTLYLKDSKNVTPAYKMKTSIDEIGNNSLETEYNATHVKRLYARGATVAYQPLDSMEYRMQNRLDSLLSRLEIDRYKNIQFTFVLPPYSALYWYHIGKLGYKNQFLDFAKYLNASVSKYGNVKIQYYFDCEEIIDLNNYSDITHFSPLISDKILENINNEDYTLTDLNIEAKRQRLDSLLTIFFENNKDWLH